MERKFLGWLFIIILLCAQALSSLAHETNSKHLMQEQEVNGVNGTTSLDGDNNGSRRDVLKKVKDFLRKAQKGKGSYGGANIVHHRPQRSAAAAALLKGSLFFMISTSNLYAGLGLVLVFVF
ncbi:hypothetical protein CsSME_00007310 [Camellia sinensis var. sinensis]